MLSKNLILWISVRCIYALLILHLSPIKAIANFWQDDESILALQQKAEAIGKRNLDSVLLLLNKAESLAKASNLQLVQANNDWIKAKTYYSLKDYTKSKEFGESGLQHGEADGFHEVSAKINNLLGVIAKRERKTDLAATYYRASLRNRENLSDSLGMSKTLQNLGNLFKGTGETDSAFFYYRESIAIKSKLDDPVSLAKTVLNLGNYYYEVGQYEKAIEQYKEASLAYQENEYEEGLAKALNNIGSAYLFLGYYNLSLDAYLKGLELYEKLDLQEEYGNTLNNVATLQKRLGHYDQAIKYYQNCLKTYDDLGNESEKFKAYLGLADVFLLKRDPESALDHLVDGEKLALKSGLRVDLASIEHVYGRVEAGLKNYVKAKQHYLKSIAIKQELNDREDLGNVYNSLGVANYEAGEYIQARQNYITSLSLAREYKLPALVRAALLGLSETNEALGNNRKAYDYRLQYENVKDSLDNVEKARQLAELREIYEAEQKDKQITQLELQNEVANAKSQANAALAAKQRTDKLIFIIAALALMVLAIFLYLHFRQRLLLSRLKVKEEKESHDQAITQLLGQQQTKSLEAMIKGQEEERIRIAKELHDHFGSLMAAVKVNLSTVAANNGVAPESERQMKSLSILVDQACEDIRGLSHSMHVGVSESFGLVPALKDLSASINHSGEIQVDFMSSQCTDVLDTTIEITAYRLVQELVSNVLKHAEAGKLIVQLTCLEDILNIIVEDDGKGLDIRNLGREQGMGLDNIKERVDGLQGEFEVDSKEGKGTTVIIDLPVSVEQTQLEYDKGIIG